MSQSVLRWLRRGGLLLIVCSAFAAPGCSGPTDGQLPPEEANTNLTPEEQEEAAKSFDAAARLNGEEGG